MGANVQDQESEVISEWNDETDARHVEVAREEGASLEVDDESIVEIVLSKVETVVSGGLHVMLTVHKLSRKERRLQFV